MRVSFQNAVAPISIAVALFAAPAIAVEPQANLAVFGGNAEGNDVDGDVLGGRASLVFAKGWFVASSYEKAEFDGDAEADEIRFGGGYLATFGPKKRVRASFQLDYVDLDAGDTFGDGGSSLGGGGAVFGLQGRFPANLRGYSRVGYILLENDVSGFEYLFGMAFEYPKSIWGLFAEYRGVRLELDSDSNADFDYDSVRAGLALRF